MTPLELFLNALPSLLVTAAGIYWKRKKAKQDKYEASLAEAKQESDRIQMDLSLATAQLSYASAMAIKRGKPNGEIEEGIKQYEKALSDFRAFERRQVARLDTKH